MDYAAAFTYITQDKEWIKKLAIASVLVLLLPLLGITLLPLMGWTMEITRRAARDEQQALPGWSDFGQYFADGLKLAVLAFVWALPLILISACLVGVGVLAGTQMASEDDAAIAIMVTNVCIIILALPYGILLGILMPAAVGTLAVTGELGSAINPANAFKLVRANPGGYIVVWLINSFVPSILSSIGSIACGIGAFVAIAYSFSALGHLYGQAYRVAEAGAPPLEAPAM